MDIYTSCFLFGKSFLEWEELGIQTNKSGENR